MLLYHSYVMSVLRMTGTHSSSMAVILICDILLFHYLPPSFLLSSSFFSLLPSFLPLSLFFSLSSFFYHHLFYLSPTFDVSSPTTTHGTYTISYHDISHDTIHFNRSSNEMNWMKLKEFFNNHHIK